MAGRHSYTKEDCVEMIHAWCQDVPGYRQVTKSMIRSIPVERLRPGCYRAYYRGFRHVGRQNDLVRSLFSPGGVYDQIQQQKKQTK